MYDIAQLYEKRCQREKLWRILAISGVAILFVSMLVISKIHTEDSLGRTAIVIVSTMSFAAVANYVYFYLHFQTWRCRRWLEQTGQGGVLQQLQNRANYLEKARIHYGNTAFFAEKSGLLIPYSAIAWVYIYQQKALYGAVTVDQAFIIRTADGKKFSVRADEAQFRALLSNVILPVYRGIIVGFTPDREKAYFQNYPQAKAAKRKLQRTWGLALLGAAALALVSLLAQGKADEGLVLPGMLGIFGGILLLLGVRK